MASLDDILTTQKNGVVAINNLNSPWKSILEQLTIIAGAVASSVPKYNSPTVAASTTQLIVAGTGIINAISIPIHAGSAQVSIYDAATTASISATNLVYKSLPSNAATFLPYEIITMPYTLGIVIVTEAGMNACVAYSPTA